jgi:hypothetical protein
MPDTCTTIPEHLMLARLAQSQQMREFFIQMWLQNPALAKHAGSRVLEMLSPLAAVPHTGHFIPPAPTIIHVSNHE